MKKLLTIISLFSTALLFLCCDKQSTGDEFGIGAGNGLNASSTNLSLLAGTEGRSVISGGMEPYSIVENTNSTVVSVQIASRELQFTALSIGSASIKVKDSSSPSKTVIIAVTVKASMTTNVPGLLRSPRTALIFR